jgi:hypothetical protein
MVVTFLSGVVISEWPVEGVKLGTQKFEAPFFNVANYLLGMTFRDGVLFLL